MDSCLLFFSFNYHPSALWNCKSDHVMSSLNLLLVLWSQNILCWCAVIVSSLLFFPYQKQQRATQTFSTMHPPKFTKSCIKNQFCRRNKTKTDFGKPFSWATYWRALSEKPLHWNLIKIADHHSTWIAVVMRVNTNCYDGCLVIWIWLALLSLLIVPP